MSSPNISTAKRDAFYEVVARRRDIRSFEPGRAVPSEALQRILQAADQAPSVGFSQPWEFVLVRDGATRSRIRESFLRCRDVEAALADAVHEGSYRAKEAATPGRDR